MNLQQQKNELLRVRSFLKADRVFFTMLYWGYFLCVIFLILIIAQIIKPEGNIAFVILWFCMLCCLIWATGKLSAARKTNRHLLKINNTLLRELNEKMERLKNES